VQFSQISGRSNESYYLLPAGGTISSSNLICVRFQIRNITDRSSSFASSMHPYNNKTLLMRSHAIPYLITAESTNHRQARDRGWISTVV